MAEIAETVMSAFVEVILKDLLPAAIKFLRDELNLPDEVKKELHGLNTEVSMLHAYLRDAAQKRQSSETLRLWLSELQDVAYEANDLLDEWGLEEQRQKVIRLAQVRNFLAVINPKRIDFLHDISNRVKEMRSRMEKIKKQGHDYGLRDYGLHLEQERLPVSRHQSSSLEPPHIRGREAEKKRVIDLLLRPSVDDESNTGVVCIVGIGGIGKTALAQLVYNDADVKQSFKLKIWVHVSQDFNQEKLTKDILESIDGFPHQTSMSLDNLQKGLLNKLRGEKYLLVLDEVWIEDWKNWDSFRIPLLYGATGSKILVTTRTFETANAMVGKSEKYDLPPLSDDDCFSLFCYYMSLLNPNITKADDLSSFYGVVAQRCNGLPSTAADLASRLWREPDRRRWSSILETDSSQSGDSSRTNLSYQLLPSRLKQCFALCALFPNGYKFDKEKLVNLWMAQDFIQQSDDRRMEEVGSEYFDYLERRSFFQCSRFDRSYYTMDNSIHNFARFATKGECVVAKHGQKIGKKARHLSLARQEERVTDLTKDLLFDEPRCIYTLVVSGKFIPDLPDDFVRKLENLRALDLSNTNLQKLPSSINYLKHLRCLELSGTEITRLPDELSELYFLQTLGLRNCCKLEKLPKGIRYLQKLRHIDLHWDHDSMLLTMAQGDITRRHRLRYMPQEIGLLKDLQTLTRFVVSERSGCGLEELENLNQLHGELLVSNVELVQRASEATKANLKTKEHLQCLELRWADAGNETQTLSETFRRKAIVERVFCELQPHTKLSGLRIVGYTGAWFPAWFGTSYLCNLTSLTLINCRQCFSLPPLGNLPLLTELHIEGMDAVWLAQCEFCGQGNEMPFRALKKLYFENMLNLRQWCGEIGCALNALLELVIRKCSMLDTITHDIPFLEKLVIEEAPRLACLPYLQCLQSLEIKRSGELFWNLFSPFTQLCSSSLEGLSTISLPDELPHFLNSLQRLKIDSCDELECFPDTWPPTSLVYFGVKFCPKLRLLPNDIKKLEVLEDMEIQSCPWLSSLPEQIGFLKALQRLDISDCRSLLSLPSFLPNKLRILSISDCPGLRESCKLGGKDWSKISDISYLWIDGKIST